VRHLGAEATILTILPEALRAGGSPATIQAERFLSRSARTLTRWGVPVDTRIRYGQVRDEIVGQIEEGGHDLVVLGSPLPNADGELKLGGQIGRLLAELDLTPVLIVRSPEAVS
jgi:nucleotide-binding universal stress UspA family protein